MEQYKRHVDIDLSPFEKDDDQATARYGLPKDVRFCKKCAVSNQRPNGVNNEFVLNNETLKVAINFDEEGVCDACRAWEAKHNEIDWDERERELVDLCDRHRRSDGHYDCLAPGSGGKDSFYASWVLKYKYGMHPLTITWAPHMYTPWGWENLQSWIHSGFDNILLTPNGRTHRLLTRLALENMFHPFQPFVFGQKLVAAKASIKHDIPLVFYGDQGTDWGLPLEEADDPQVSYQWLDEHPESDIFLSGMSVANLKEHFGLVDADFLNYLPIESEKTAKTGTEICHLGYYIKWHPQANYYFAVENSGFQPSPERTPGTYSKYAGIDDKVDDFNFYCYFVKFGMGRATTDASQETRAGDITRDEAVALIRRYDGEFPERFVDDFFKYVSLPEKEFPAASKMFEQPIMDREYFDHLADRFRSPHIWRYENGAWTLRHAAWQES